MRPTEDLAILIVSWDGFRDVWPALLDCFFRHWPDCPYPVHLGSNAVACDEPRVRPLTVGADAGYSANLIAMLERIEQEWVLIWLDDVLLSGPVDAARLEALLAQARAAGAGHVRLNVEPPYVAPLFARWKRGLEAGELPPGSPYRVSIALSLWRRGTLRAVLEPGESAWQAERRGAARSDRLAEPFLCAAPTGGRRPVVPFVHGVIKGRWTWEAARFLRRAGLGAHLGVRPVATFAEHVLSAAYARAAYLGCLALSALPGTRAGWLVRQVITRRGDGG
jgi:hypothetical protein